MQMYISLYIFYSPASFFFYQCALLVNIHTYELAGHHVSAISCCGFCLIKPSRQPASPAYG